MKPRAILAPEPGFFRMRLVRYGPFVGARIWRPCPIEISVREPWQAIDRWPPLDAEIDGEPAQVLRVWLYGDTISELDFLVLTESSRWARAYQPTNPIAEPRKAVDRSTMPMPF